MNTLESLNSLFQHQYESSTLHHAWIIEGAEDGIVLPIVRECISKVLNTTIAETNFHPSLHWLNANDSKTVDDVRLAIHFLEKTSWDGGWKVCVIVGVDQLNSQGQNALLKVVEEPPEKTLILLVSKRTNTLLPTLYSRGLHIVLSQHESNETHEESSFFERWVEAVIQIIDHQNYNLLFVLQAYLSDNDITPQQEGKWVLQTFKKVIDAYHAPMNDHTTNLARMLSVWSSSDSLKRWDAAQRYVAQATEFMIDQKQMCIKLTTKILEK